MSVSLHSVSNPNLITDTRAAAARERGATLDLLHHLVEVDERRAYLELGYSSMFDFCTRDLGCSSGAAFRRIQTARCLARYPELQERLERNEVNVSTVAQISRILLKNGRAELISRIAGKSQREVEAIVAEYQPGVVPRDRVRTVIVEAPANVPSRETPSIFAAAVEMVVPGAGSVEEPAVLPACEKTAYFRSGTDAKRSEAFGEVSGAARVEELIAPPACEKSAYFRSETDAEQREASSFNETPATSKRTTLTFSVKPEFMTALDKIKVIAWHRLPANPSLEQVLQLAMDYMIEKEDPIKRMERREQRKRRELKDSTRPRHIAAARKDDVFRRDNARCAFVGSDGRRCSATIGLQVDHIQPVALGGRGESGNLRLLCAAHNRFEARRMGLGRPS